jgi:hypothetical protein
LGISATYAVSVYAFALQILREKLVAGALDDAFAVNANGSLTPIETLWNPPKPYEGIAVSSSVGVLIGAPGSPSGHRRAHLIEQG